MAEQVPLPLEPAHPCLFERMPRCPRLMTQDAGWRTEKSHVCVFRPRWRQGPAEPPIQASCSNPDSPELCGHWWPLPFPATPFISTTSGPHPRVGRDTEPGSSGSSGQYHRHPSLKDFFPLLWTDDVILGSGYFYRLYSVKSYYKIMASIPSATQYILLLIYFICNSLYLLIPSPILPLPTSCSTGSH